MKSSLLFLTILIAGCSGTPYMAPVENDVSHIFKSDNTVGTPYLCVEGRLQKMKTGKAEVWPEGMGMEIFGEYQKFETKLKLLNKNL
jgi:hypothetical protein